MLHLLPILVILLPLPRRRPAQRHADHGGAAQAPANGVVESVHVLGQEALADKAERLDFLLIVRHQLRAPEGDGRAVLKGERAVLGTDRRRAFRHGREAHFRMGGKSVEWKYHVCPSALANERGRPYAVPSGRVKLTVIYGALRIISNAQSAGISLLAFLIYLYIILFGEANLLKNIRLFRLIR